MMWENVTPFQVDKLWSQVVHYYINKKKMSKEEANKIAAAIVKKEIEKNRNVSTVDPIIDEIRGAINHFFSLSLSNI